MCHRDTIYHDRLNREVPEIAAKKVNAPLNLVLEALKLKKTAPVKA